MKALEILKIDRDYCLAINNDKSIIVQYDEAIKELEDLQNRSCENCKYNKEQDNFMIFCDKEMSRDLCQNNSKMMWHSFTKDFCCKYWESK